jgi:hypothetical protein
VVDAPWISERIERLDAEREKLSGQLNELEVAERVVKRFGGKAGTTGKRGRARPAAQTAPAEARSAREPTGANNVAKRCTRGRADARACRPRQRNRPVLVDALTVMIGSVGWRAAVPDFPGL